MTMEEIVLSLGQAQVSTIGKINSFGILNEPTDYSVNVEPAFTHKKKPEIMNVLVFACSVGVVAMT